MFARRLSAVLPFLFTVSLAANPIVRENRLPGTGDWQLTRGSEDMIEGFASATSVAQGSTVELYVSTRVPDFTVEIFRLGWYGGSGGRSVHGPVALRGVARACPPPAPLTGLVECAWPSSLSLPIPTDWTTGVYVAKLKTSEGHQSHIPFIVRDDRSHPRLLFQVAVTTWQAYNDWGGKSLYSGEPQATVVSFDRPYRQANGAGDLFRWEYQMIRFLEREGYDISYITNLDVHRSPSRLRTAGVVLSVGHDEYWSKAMRDGFESALAHGVDLAFFSANTAYWQVRFEPGLGGRPDRRMVSYKETARQDDPYATDDDPFNDAEITTKWRDEPLNRSEASLLGVAYQSGNWGIDADLVIDRADHWIFEGTGLSKGSVLPGLLGYEVDQISPESPAELIRLAHSPFWSRAGAGDLKYSDMVIRTTADDALVFAAGTIQFSWGLDGWGPQGDRSHPAAQRMARNLLDRMIGDGERRRAVTFKR